MRRGNGRAGETRKGAWPPSHRLCQLASVRVAATVSRLDGISGAPNLADRGDIRHTVKEEWVTGMVYPAE